MVMSFEMTMDQAIQFFVLKGDAVLFAWILAEQAGLPIPTIPLLLAAGALANTGRIHLARSLILKSGVKFSLFDQICPKIERLCPRFMQQSIKFHKSSFSSPAVSTGELDAVSCLSTWQ